MIRFRSIAFALGSSVFFFAILLVFSSHADLLAPTGYSIVGNHADGSFSGTTGEDCFYGVTPRPESRGSTAFGRRHRRCVAAASPRGSMCRAPLIRHDDQESRRPA